MKFDKLKEKLKNKTLWISAAAAAFFVVAAIFASRNKPEVPAETSAAVETVTEAPETAPTVQSEEQARVRTGRYSRPASLLKQLETEEEEEYVPSPTKLNLAYYFPEDADTSDSIYSYAGEIFTELNSKNADYFASYYDLTDRTPLAMAQSRGLGADRVMGKYNPDDSNHDPNNPATWIINRFKNINITFYNGDGKRITGYYTVKEIMAMANVYAYYHGIDDEEFVRDYCRKLFDQAFSARVSLGNVYYDDGCLNRSVEEEAAEAIAQEAAQSALDQGAGDGDAALALDGETQADVSGDAVMSAVSQGYAVVGMGGTYAATLPESTDGTTGADENVVIDEAEQPLTEADTETETAAASGEGMTAAETSVAETEQSEQQTAEGTVADTAASDTMESLSEAGTQETTEAESSQAAGTEVMETFEDTAVPETVPETTSSQVTETPAAVPETTAAPTVEYIDDLPLDANTGVITGVLRGIGHKLLSLSLWKEAHALTVHDPAYYLAEEEISAEPAAPQPETAPEAAPVQDAAVTTDIPAETEAPQTNLPQETPAVPETAAVQETSAETSSSEIADAVPAETKETGEDFQSTYYAVDADGNTVSVFSNPADADAIAEEARQQGGSDNGGAETSAAAGGNESTTAESISAEGETTAATSDAETAETSAEAGENAEDPDEKNYCPGHVDLYVSITIRGTNEKKGLFKVDPIGNDEANFNDQWQGWTEERIKEVQELCKQDWFEKYGLSISSIKLSASLTDEEIQHYLDTLPSSVSEERKAVVDFALHSVGKVPYYWGGKPAGAGYASNHFNVLTVPDNRGRILSGLDCSGWVNWVYWSATGTPLAGQSTGTLIGCGRRISRSALQPGDIIIRTGEDAHVVMFLCWAGNGNFIGIHETGGVINNVVVREMTASWPYYRALIE